MGQPWFTDRLSVIEGDITRQAVDAIVNAANEELAGGGGVDGAIHRAAGPDLTEECHGIGGCPTGQACLTSGYRLPARYIIHTVGPVWRGGGQGEESLLASCYRTSLLLAAKQMFKTIAFPAISTGVYRFPLELAAQVAVRECASFLENSPHPVEVRLVCFGAEATRAYREALADQAV